MRPTVGDLFVVDMSGHEVRSLVFSFLITGCFEQYGARFYTGVKNYEDCDDMEVSLIFDENGHANGYGVGWWIRSRSKAKHWRSVCTEGG